MLTTGFKLYFGMCLGALVAAVTFGYTTGGNNTGPISLGWKGAVGNQSGYLILIGVATACGFLGLVLVAFRDADPRAAAQLLGVDQVPAQRPTQPSYWPLVAMFGVAAVLLGLVLSSEIFVAGLGVLAIVAIEHLYTPQPVKEPITANSDPIPDYPCAARTSMLAKAGLTRDPKYGTKVA